MKSPIYLSVVPMTTGFLCNHGYSTPHLKPDFAAPFAAPPRQLIVFAIHRILLYNTGQMCNLVNITQKLI